MKPNTVKFVFVFCLAIALSLFLGACSGGQESGNQEPGSQEPVKIEIQAPSRGETTIAPGRQFKVSGSLSGEVPDDASLRVTLLDAAGDEVRHATRCT